MPIGRAITWPALAPEDATLIALREEADAAVAADIHLAREGRLLQYTAAVGARRFWRWNAGGTRDWTGTRAAAVGTYSHGNRAGSPAFARFTRARRSRRAPRFASVARWTPSGNGGENFDASFRADRNLPITSLGRYG